MRYRIYWIHNSRETDPLSEGYIGVTTKTLTHRLKQHKWKSKSLSYTVFRSDDDDKIELLETYTSEKKAYIRESELRPDRNIGRNIAAGGQGGSFQKKSDEHKKNISAGKQAWWNSPAGQAKKKEFSEKMQGNTQGGQKIPHNSQPCKINGVVYTSVRVAGRELNIPQQTVRYRLDHGTYGYLYL